MAVYTLRRDDDRAIHYTWNADLPPVLRVPPGAEVTIETRSGEDDQLRASSEAADVEAIDMRRLHALSGPIFVEGARPGDTLAVSILEVAPGGWGFTMQRPGAGFLLGFPTYLRTYDLSAREIEFAPGIHVARRPFLGVMGVAPAEPGEHSTIPPGPHGGNLDCRDLVAGSTLYLPVFVQGALFSCGDGHAAQGDGEVCVTAIECALTARLRFDVLAGQRLKRPRAETPDAWLTLGAAETFEAAARQALEDMLDLIAERLGLARADAYALASVAVDIRVNQLVNRPMIGVRAVLPTSILR